MSLLSVCTLAAFGSRKHFTLSAHMCKENMSRKPTRHVLTQNEI